MGMLPVSIFFARSMMQGPTTRPHLVRRHLKDHFKDIDIAVAARHIASVGPHAVARLTQGISPKHCNSPARRAENFWRYV